MDIIYLQDYIKFWSYFFTKNWHIIKIINVTVFIMYFLFSRRYLRETLKMANAEDLNRLTSCSLVLLGHIFLALGNSRESMNMVTPAMQLASKIPDIHVQLWASAILKGIFIRWVKLFYFYDVCAYRFVW